MATIQMRLHVFYSEQCSSIFCVYFSVDFKIIIRPDFKIILTFAGILMTSKIFNHHTYKNIPFCTKIQMRRVLTYSNILYQEFFNIYF